MNNTTNLTIAAILVAATLVVGTLGSISTIAQPALAAYGHKKVGSQDNNSRNSKNGNTVTIEECKNKGSASGFDTATNQECENLICTHPGENATCTEEGVRSISTPTPTPTPTPTTIQVSGQGERGQNVCPDGTSLAASITFSVQQNVGGAVQGQFNVDVDFPGNPFTKTGTLDSVQITGNSFTITGKELSAGSCEDIVVPPTATITGQCGTGVTIQFATAHGENAILTNANVVCTTT
jgi:hypothetical protein